MHFPHLQLKIYQNSEKLTREGRGQQPGRAGALRRTGVCVCGGGVAAGFPAQTLPPHSTAAPPPPSGSAAAAEASPAACRGAAVAAARPRNGKRCGGRAEAASKKNRPPPSPHIHTLPGADPARRRLAPPLPLWPPLTRPPHGLGHGRALPENGSGAGKRRRRKRRSRTGSRARAPRGAISDCVMSLGSARSVRRGWCRQQSTGLHLFNSPQVMLIVDHTIT
ncbi:sterile alpha motif domain-containing protein 1-like [Oenanthe melanoleuca]|uniref:sterile alpha motif domain-containing protein 1-like n=1 Tax=Oenanthe melanoleuca TaxID=2939378 RepID=UPI0024C1E29E|nr:sterile alpha motif domain-containing protein 1-like [Oenanthe melanoleuca]